jgi:ketosteroid isomerase-like protein
MPTKTAATSDESAIRVLVDGWTRALRARDIDRLMTHYAPNVLVYDIAPPLALRGAAAYRRSWEEWLPSFAGPIGYEVHELDIRIGGDVAFSTGFHRIRGKRSNGEETDLWARATAGYRKIDGRWLIAHDHVSVPFHMDGSLRAAVDLKP